MTTEAEQFVTAELARILDGKTPYRVGVIFLTYADDPSDENSCRVAHGCGLSEPFTREHAVGLVEVIKTMRYLADVIDAKIHNRPPPPAPEGIRP